jgi:hypothetical protein
MVNPALVLAGVLALQVFALLSSVDGLYVHLWRLGLHRRPDSYCEHLWHTARAVLFAPIVVILFAMPSAGALLWLGAFLAFADQVVGVFDVLSETESRRSLGGLGRGEYALHVVLVAVHAAATALVLAARPAEAWSLSAPSTLGDWPAMASMLVTGSIVGGIVVAALHLALAWRHRPRVGFCCATGVT